LAISWLLILYEAPQIFFITFENSACRSTSHGWK
jgi:hypothetical protein